MDNHDELGDDVLIDEIKRVSQMDETVAIAHAIRDVKDPVGEFLNRDDGLRAMAIVMAILHADEGKFELADAVVARIASIKDARIRSFLNGNVGSARPDPKA